MTEVYLALAKVEFDYDAQTEEELSVREDQLVWVLEDDDAEWFKVKVKEANSVGESGLVPASYLAQVTPLRTVTALYAYTPARNDEGEMENEEELALTEGELLNLLEEEQDWFLVSRQNGKGAGFVPATYVDSPDQDSPPIDQESSLPLSLPPASVTAYVDPSERVAATTNGSTRASDVKTWSVSELDKKKKKKKGTLGVGNGAVFFASESDKTPVQQYPLSDLVDVTSEKSKHLLLSFPDDVELHFVISSKEMLDEIVEKIENSRSTPAKPIASATPSARFVPPLPVQSTSSYSAPSPRAVATSPVASSPGPYLGGKGDAVALYDFEAQGDDELDVTEGDRLVIIIGGSDDADWIKCRKANSALEGVVPASYVQPDEVPRAGPTAEERRRAQEEAAADEADTLALQEQLERDTRAIDDRRSAAAAKVQFDRETKDTQRRKDSAAEIARQKRMSQAPPATSLQLPERGDDGGRDRDKSTSARSQAAKKPSANRVRTWKDRTGQFKVDAEFLGLNGSKIRLHKLNGVIIEVPMEKMSAEDTAYITRVTKRQTSGDDDTPLARIADREQRRDERHRRGQSAAAGVSQPVRGSSKSTSAPAKRTTDWFEFFLNAGCDMDDCTRYATNFQRDRIDEDLLLDLEQSTMRSLGLREGDIIRVSKFIKEQYAPPPTPDKSDRDAQIAADALMARNLAGPVAPPPGLFTSASGGLKTQRRGRPANGRQTSTAVDSASISAATEELAKRSATPPISRFASPPNGARARSASTTLLGGGGFDDDAWTVKPASKPTTPSVTPAPLPAPIEPVPAPISTSVSTPLAGPAAPTLSYNDGLLAQMGIGNRPPSAPPLNQQPSFASIPSPPLYNGPRGPTAPIYANQPLLNPLIPTQTGMNGFIPTRAPMMPQMTGYPMMGMAGYPSLQPQMTGMLQQQPMQMQPTGVYGLQPQATGMYNQTPSYNPQPNRFSPQPSPIQFNPTPPPVQAQSPESTTMQFQPSSVFASMKPGGFTNGNGPQEPGRYDALRPQATGQVLNQPLQSQQTGFLQPQQTGFPMQQPQPTGFGFQNQMFPPSQQYGRQY